MYLVMCQAPTRSVYKCRISIKPVIIFTLPGISPWASHVALKWVSQTRGALGDETASRSWYGFSIYDGEGYTFVLRPIAAHVAF